MADYPSSPAPARLLIATNNAHKVIEFRRILGPLGFELVSPRDESIDIEVDETGSTFEENALLKACAFADASGLSAVADDSGLVVDALGGEPGVYSARYGGPGLDDAGRCRLVLSRLLGVPEEQRTARFAAAIALVGFGPGPLAVRGHVDGRIADESHGIHGFGYDPIFYYPPFGCTFGEAGPEQKDRVSHRAAALRELARVLTGTGPAL